MTQADAVRPTVHGPAAAWGLLGLAVAFEIAGALGLRFSVGFTRSLPTLCALAAFGTALVIVARVMRALPVSIAYPVWAGGGTVGVALLGIAWLHEPLTLAKAAGIALVLAGVVLINRVAEKACGC